MGIYEEVTFEESTSSLFEVIYNLAVQGSIVLHINESAVPLEAVYIEYLNVTAFYVSNAYDIRGVNQDISLRISRIQYGPELMPYGLVRGVDVIRSLFFITSRSIRKVNKSGLDKFPKISAWVKGDVDPPVTKISASHLRSVSMKELRRLDTTHIFERISYMLPCLERLARADMHEAMFIGLVCWAYSLGETEHEVSRVSGIWQWDYSGVLEFAGKVKKEFSLRLKAVQNLVALDLRPFFELEVLVNRGVGSIDWEQEKINRVKPNTADFSYNEVFEASTKLFFDIKDKGAKPKRIEWSDYWANRWEWAPTGSSHSQYKEDSEYRATDAFNRHKLFTVSNMGTRDFKAFHSRRREMVSWPSEKHEWTKVRAIYGVDLTNFIMTGFAMGDCEEVLSKQFPIGPSATEENVRATVGQLLKNGTPYCFDFEDFNSQHSTDSMKAVIDAYGAVFSSELTEEQREAISWVSDSFENSYIVDNSPPLANNHAYLETGERVYKTEGTLMSGCRLTTFLNTVLNYLYVNIDRQDDDKLVATHNGDDILAVVGSLNDVQRLAIAAKKRNIRYQNSKCFLGAIAEFLRIDHKSGGGGQYLTRAISTIVHGPTEMVVPNNLLALLGAINTRRKEAVERGGNAKFLQSVQDSQYHFITGKWDISVEDINTILTTHVSKGGLNEEISPTSLDYTVSLDEERSAEKKESVLQDESRAMPGAMDYARQLARGVIPVEYIDRVYKAAKKTITALSCSNRYIVRIEKNKEVGVEDVMKANRYGLYRKYTNIGKLNLARAFNIPLISLKHNRYDVMSLINSEKDKMTALRILF